MRFTRRRFLSTIGLAAMAAVGCTQGKQDNTPNPELGPPPTDAPPKRDGAPSEKTGKKK